MEMVTTGKKKEGEEEAAGDDKDRNTWTRIVEINENRRAGKWKWLRKKKNGGRRERC